MFTWVLGARLLPQSYQYPNLSEGTDLISGQLHGNKECSFSGITKSGRVWRKVPESDALSVPGNKLYKHVCECVCVRERVKPQLSPNTGWSFGTADNATEYQDYQSARPASDTTGVSNKKGFTQPSNNLYKRVCVTHQTSLSGIFLKHCQNWLCCLFYVCEVTGFVDWLDSVFVYDPSLTVLRWPCVVDRTLKSNYYYWWGTLLCAAVHWHCQRPPKGLGTTKTGSDIVSNQAC